MEAGAMVVARDRAARSLRVPNRCMLALWRNAAMARLKIFSALAAEEQHMKWRHKNCGTTYNIIGVAALQTANPSALCDNKVVVVYQGEDGQLWVRASDEFHDGRYEKID
jgi:hypothetical protein